MSVARSVIIENNQNSRTSEQLNLVKAYSTSSEVQAHLICQRLVDEGILAQVVGQHIDNGQPLPSSVEIWVPNKEVKPTAKFLKDWDVIRQPSASTEPFSIATAALFLVGAVSVIALVGASDNLTAFTWLGVTVLLAATSVRVWFWSHHILKLTRNF